MVNSVVFICFGSVFFFFFFNGGGVVLFSVEINTMHGICLMAFRPFFNIDPATCNGVPAGHRVPPTVLQPTTQTAELVACQVRTQDRAQSCCSVGLMVHVNAVHTDANHLQHLTSFLLSRRWFCRHAYKYERQQPASVCKHCSIRLHVPSTLHDVHYVHLCVLAQANLFLSVFCTKPPAHMTHHNESAPCRVCSMDTHSNMWSKPRSVAIVASALRVLPYLLHNR